MPQAKKPRATIEKKDDMSDVRKDVDFRSIYINNVSFGMTRFDFQMVLGLVEITKDESELKTRELASVKMTLPYAKALLKDMGAVIEAYEKKFGEIPLPPEI